jgi:hypothetical protein
MHATGAASLADALPTGSPDPVAKVSQEGGSSQRSSNHAVIVKHCFHTGKIPISRKIGPVGPA